MVNKIPVRRFSLGIGGGVSTALIEGVARAGNGFCQFVQDREKFESKLVRMLKGALSPHILESTMEVKYGTSCEEDFEIIDKVADTIKLEPCVSEDDTVKSPEEPVSLYDSKETDSGDLAFGAESQRPADFPSIEIPHVLQAPTKVPPLFAFSRTTVYLLLSPKASSLTPVSVTLRATSSQGPLHLEIPVYVIE